MSLLLEEHPTLFPTSYAEIKQRVRKIDPMKYGSTRNFINGAVTYLSPYISRGVISTQRVFAEILERGYHPSAVEKFIQELAWRDYWQQVWIAKGDAINSDMKNTQAPVANHSISTAIVNATTGIEAIDSAITDFYKTGYLHNHLRMYIATIACNVAQSHWKTPARWMYYHLLDGDWASNTLSWQWVAGANSHKKYIANQENINKYCHTRQKGTFLDVSYEALQDLPVPGQLMEQTELKLETQLPDKQTATVDPKLPTYLYNFYNLDPEWKKQSQANRILLLEPSHFRKYPVSDKSVEFMLALSENIENMQVYVGEFHELQAELNFGNIYYKEHPLNRHYDGVKESRDWMFEVTGYFPSFFSYWKKCKKQIPK